MKRMAFLVIFLAGLIGGMEWLSQGFTSSWEPRLRTYLEKTTSQLTQTNVKIDGITLGFFQRVRLVNVRVTEAEDPQHPIFQAGQIELTLSLIDLPRALARRRPYEAIGLVSLENPWIRLSPETIARHTSTSRRAVQLPPWFTLAWSGGTLQWQDKRAPRGAWTLYQTEGTYRIRGPQMSLTVLGSIVEARHVRFQITSLGHRWNARAMVTDGDTSDVLAAIQTLTKRSPLPSGWQMRGGFELDAKASGRHWPESGDDWTHFLDRAVLTLHPHGEEKEVPGPSIAVAGTFAYQKGEISGTHLRFETPWLDGQGQAHVHLGNNPADRPVTVEATLASGKIGAWPYSDAAFNIRYHHKQWEILQSSLHFLNGTVSAKGTVSAADSDMAITAQDISLSAIGKERGIQSPEGSLNASFTFRGPPKEGQLAGAWWLSNVQWGRVALGDARGDFEIAADHFQAQAKSDRTPFRLALAGNQSDKTVELEQLNLSLPSGASFSAHGRLLRSRGSIQGNFDASRISLRSDIPYLSADDYGLAGMLSAQGRLSGTLDRPTVKVTLQSDDLSQNGNPLGSSAATILWDKSHYEITNFRMGTGIEGRFANAEGTLKIHNAQIGKWSLSQGGANFKIAGHHAELLSLSLQTATGELTGKGKTSWETGADGATHLNTEGQGRLKSRFAAETFDVPFDFNGQFHLAKNNNEGSLHVNARLLDGELRGDYTLQGGTDHPAGRFTAHLENARWRAFEFSSDMLAAWSAEGFKPLALKGRFKTGGNFDFNGLFSRDAQANGTLVLDHVNLHPLGESLRFPKGLDGAANATLTLSGPVAHLKWNGHLEGDSLVYAPESDHPFKLEKFYTDMTMQPLDSDPSITHLTLNDGQASTAEELIRFTPGSFLEFAGDRPARLSLGTQIRNLHLGIFTLFGGLDLDGTWRIQPQGFAIRTKAKTRSLFINDYELQEGLILAEYYNGVLNFPQPPNAPPLVTGTVDFHKAPQLTFTDFFISGAEKQGLQLSGQIGPSLWDFNLGGRGLDIGTLSELSGFPYTLSGTADVQVHGTGDADHPHAEGKVDLTNGTALGLSYRNGAAAFVWQDGRISFTKLSLNDPGRYHLDGAGVFPLRQPPASRHPTASAKNKKSEEPAPASSAIDFSLRLQDSNLGLLQSLSNEVKSAKGAVEGLIQIKGTLEDPQLHGSLRVTNGSISGAHYFRELRGANLALDFDENTIYIRDVRARSGNGEFYSSGTITLNGFVPSQYDVKFEVVTPKGVDVQVPELAIPDSPLAKKFKFLTSASHFSVRGHVALRGPAESPTFSGEGIFADGHFTFPPSHKRPPPAAVLEWFRRIYWDVKLQFQDNAWFDNELVQANVVGTLTMKGPSDRLQVNASLEIPEGKISYLGLQFDIRQAHYDVRSSVTDDKVVNTPFVRGVAESQIQAVDTVSGVSGASGGSRLNVNDTITLNIDYAPVDQIKPRLTSAANPTMSQDKLLARVTNTDMENLTPAERNAVYQRQLVSVIDSSLTTPLAQNVLKKTGLADRLRVQRIVDPNAAAAQDLNASTNQTQQQSTAVNLFANTKYTIEKDLSTRLSLGYGVRFVQSANVDPDVQQQQKLDLISDVQLSYRWFRNVYVRGDFDLPTSNQTVLPERKVTIEPRWRFGWWGNTNKDKVPKKENSQ